MTRSGAKTFWKKELPPGVAYLTNNDSWSRPINWKATTWKDIFAERKARQEININFKLSGQSIIKPCFIWVFKNEQSFPFGGWWIYIKIFKEDIVLNFRNHKPRLILKCMQLFPCGILPVNENFHLWVEAFEKEFHKTGRRKKNGLVMCHCKMLNGQIVDIGHNFENEI